MPGGRERPLHLQSTTDLWVGVVFVPAFGSFFVAVPLLGTPVNGSWWSTFWLVLFLVGFFTLAGVLGSPSRLKELHRRGECVPPGIARQSVLVSIVLALLVMAAGVADIFAMAGVASLAVAAGLREVVAGVLASAVGVSLAGAAVFVLWRLARNRQDGRAPAPPEPLLQQDAHQNKPV